MSDRPPLSHFICEPAADSPGWLRWQMADTTRFNEAVIGPLLARAEGADHCRVRMQPQRRHSNNNGNAHGGAILGLIDIALFAAMQILRGVEAGQSSTVDLSTQFIGAGDITRPLDAVVEVLRETRRLGFLRGVIEQDGALVASFQGTIRKPTAPRP